MFSTNQPGAIVPLGYEKENPVDRIYELYDARTNKPLSNSDDEPLVLVCRDEPPQNDDLITVDDREYAVQRVWDGDGKITLRLRQQGVVLC